MTGDNCRKYRVKIQPLARGEKFVRVAGWETWIYLARADADEPQCKNDGGASGFASLSYTELVLQNAAPLTH